jgi:hypothetical protein
MPRRGVWGGATEHGGRQSPWRSEDAAVADGKTEGGRVGDWRSGRVIAARKKNGEGAG